MSVNITSSRAIWYCIYTVHKNRKNAVISSSVIIASLIVTYGTHDLVHNNPHGAISPPISSPNIPLEERESHTSYICYTNDVNLSRRLGRRSNIFKAEIPDNGLVFLSVGIDIKHVLSMNHTSEGNSCFTVDNTFLYHCCGYSPYRKDPKMSIHVQESNFEFKRLVVTDNYFRIEETFTGKPIMVDLSIAFQFEKSNQTIDVTSRHRCRGDVAVDKYPEVHIDINTGNNGNVTECNFHWYL